MLTKKSKGMINLGVMPDKMTGITGAPKTAAPQEPSYPSVYIDKDIGLQEEDAGQTLTANISFKIKRVSKEVNSEGKTTHSSSLEIRGIKINRG